MISDVSKGLPTLFPYFLTGCVSNRPKFRLLQRSGLLLDDLHLLRPLPGSFGGPSICFSHSMVSSPSSIVAGHVFLCLSHSTFHCNSASGLGVISLADSLSTSGCYSVLPMPSFSLTHNFSYRRDRHPCVSIMLEFDRSILSLHLPFGPLGFWLVSLSSSHYSRIFQASLGASPASTELTAFIFV